MKMILSFLIFLFCVSNLSANAYVGKINGHNVTFETDSSGYGNLYVKRQQTPITYIVNPFGDETQQGTNEFAPGAIIVVSTYRDELKLKFISLKNGNLRLLKVFEEGQFIDYSDLKNIFKKQDF